MLDDVISISCLTGTMCQMRRTVVLAGLMSVALCAAVMYASTPHDDEDAKLLSKVQKMGIVKHLKVCKNAARPVTSLLRS